MVGQVRLRVFRVGAVLVGAFFALRRSEHDVVDGDEAVPAAFAHVVHPADGHGDGGQQYGKAVKIAQEWQFYQASDKPNSEGNDKVEKHEVPVLSPPGPASNLT